MTISIPTIVARMVAAHYSRAPLVGATMRQHDERVRRHGHRLTPDHFRTILLRNSQAHSAWIFRPTFDSRIDPAAFAASEG